MMQVAEGCEGNDVSVDPQLVEFLVKKAGAEVAAPPTVRRGPLEINADLWRQALGHFGRRGLSVEVSSSRIYLDGSRHI